MAIRVTAAEVREIVKTKPSHNLIPFIAAANQLVDDCCLEFEYTDAKLKRIEQWLAAHFYCIQYSRALQQMAGTTQKTVQSKVDLYLRLTHYGQMAVLLDTEGGLAALQNNAEVTRRVLKTLLWLGKDEDA